MSRPELPVRKLSFRKPLLFLSACLASILVLVTIFLRYNKDAPIQAASEGPIETKAPTVAVLPIQQRNLRSTVTLTAELRPWNVAKIYAKVSGYLESINVDYGSYVHAGEVIAKLQLPEQTTDLERKSTEYQLAKTTYDRLMSVEHQTPGMLAQQDIDNARAAYEAAKDERDQAAVVFNYTNILAPFDGIVTKRNVDPGALIAQGIGSTAEPPLVEIADERVLRLVLDVPEDIVEKIHVGTPVDVQVSGMRRIIPASVSRIADYVQDTTRTEHTEVNIDNADFRLKPGMYASASIVLARANKAYSVPPDTISNDGKPSIIVVDRNDIVHRRVVTLGLQTPRWTQISTGIQRGDRVYIGDASAVTMGMKVTPKQQAAIGA